MRIQAMEIVQGGSGVKFRVVRLQIDKWGGESYGLEVKGGRGEDLGNENSAMCETMWLWTYNDDYALNRQHKALQCIGGVFDTCYVSALGDLGDLLALRVW